LRSILAKADGRSQQEPTAKADGRSQQEPTVDPSKSRWSIPGRADDKSRWLIPTGSTKVKQTAIHPSLLDRTLFRHQNFSTKRFDQDSIQNHQTY
jgi:hypothetical protein